MKKTLKEIAEVIGGELVGDAGIIISSVASITNAKEGDIAFIFEKGDPALIETTKASCVVVPKDVQTTSSTVIKVDKTQIAFKKIVDLLSFNKVCPPTGIHSTVFLPNNIELGNNVAIGAYVVVEDGVKIGDNTILYPFSYVGSNTSIGKECLIYPNVVIRENCVIKDRVIIHSGSVIGADGFGYDFDMQTGSFVKIPQIGNVILEDDVEIGACVTIDRAKIESTIVGRGSKIDNLTQIAHNVKIGRSTVIAAQTGIAGSTEVGSYVMMGGQVGVVDHVKIGDKVRIGAKGGVSKSIEAGKTVMGIPARDAMKTAKIVAVMEKLPEIYKKLRKFEKMMDNS